MTLPAAKTVFKFATQSNLTRITNWKAKDLAELAVCLREVPGSAIFYHTHRFLEQHQSLSPEPPNDFAYWVNAALQDERLAEKLSAIDTTRFTSVHDLREKIAITVENHLKHVQHPRQAMPGEEFYFMQSITFVLQTPYEAHDLAEFAETLKKVSIHSIYYHVFEARMRPPLGINDFSDWLDKSLDERQLARDIAGLDPYTQTLEGLRGRIVRLVERRLEQMSKGAGHAIAQ